LGLSFVGVLLAIGIWFTFYMPGTYAPVALAGVYVLGGAGLIYGMWVGEEVPRLRRHLPGILVFIVLSLGAFAGGSWLREQRVDARLEQSLENPESAP